jgi:hypothetical protein
MCAGKESLAGSCEKICLYYLGKWGNGRKKFEKAKKN